MLDRSCPPRLPLPRALVVAGGLMLAAPASSSADAPPGEVVDPRAQLDALAPGMPSRSCWVHVVIVTIDARSAPTAR